jgi:hypothetical protein
MKFASSKLGPHGTRSGQSAEMRPKRQVSPPIQPQPTITQETSAAKPGSTEAMRARIGSMTAAELSAFRDNAARIAMQEGNRKQEQAAELLPEIDAEILTRKATRLVIEADKRKASVTKRAATRTTRKRIADNEEAAAARLGDSNDGENLAHRSEVDDDLVQNLDGRLTAGTDEA